MTDKQIRWKKENLPLIKDSGYQNKVTYQHILPKRDVKYNFYDNIYESIMDYASRNSVKPHTGIHNMLSSWVLCANYYWPFNNANGFLWLRDYLNTKLNNMITEIVSFDLEFMDDDIKYQPKHLLGEDDGMRGSGQTSPDLAVTFTDKKGEKGIILIESKFTEHSFYQCSGYMKTKPGKPVNHDKNRCRNTALLVKSGFNDCHLKSWGRKYWEILKNDLHNEYFIGLDECPAIRSAYQLLRQQALAKGLQDKYKIVINAVFYDKRNEMLINSMKLAGLNDFGYSWQNLFPGLNHLWLDHNEWWGFAKNNSNDYMKWIDYIENRYIKINA